MEECLSIIGKTLGDFETTTLIGSGGMGEVYRAKDLTLRKNVAIKALAEEYVSEIGQIFSHYRIIEEIAVGGMG